jgi:pimeloyl-ACP methyl ester carboxylesterase
MTEQFADVGRGITLCYETFGEESAPPMLLIQGLGMQMIGWPDEFCEQLAARGFYVVRFDNRDIGRSTRVRGRPPTPGQLLRRRIDPVHYTLSDMAQDAAGLLRELGLEPAHVVGVSMGGMIAQTLAAEHPSCVRSLVSIMSNTGHRWKGQPAFRIYRYLLRRAPEDRAGFIEHTARIFREIGSQGLPQDTELIREIAARSHDRGHARDPRLQGPDGQPLGGRGHRPCDPRFAAPHRSGHGARSPAGRLAAAAGRDLGARAGGRAAADRRKPVTAGH